MSAEKFLPSVSPQFIEAIEKNDQFQSSDISIGDEERIAHLVTLGKDKGYVTHDDMVKVLSAGPEEDNQLDEDILDAAFSELINAGVDVKKDEKQERVDEKKQKVRDNIADDELFLSKVNVDDPMALYLREVGKVPLLTIDEEVSLSKRVEKGINARVKFAKESSTPKQRLELIEDIKDGWEAREHLITANTRLVISVAKKFMGRGVPIIDLIQDGNIGLMRAAKKFEYQRGLKFSTYATWWIRQAVSRSIADQGRTIRLPVHMGDQINRMLRASHVLTQTLGRDPSVMELAIYIDEPPDKVLQMMKTSMRPISTEWPVDADSDSVLGDFIPDKDAELPIDEVTKNLLSVHMREVLEQLPPREVKVLKLRFGLGDGETYTLKQIGRKLNITRERVRQIEAQALNRLRHPQNRRVLEDYLID